ncbi:HNH endonuclease [Novosphingobium mangrovi (ex Huang et al. 2023)]|uniref:HNH endonuclease n=1 Tax=Novosphingobium mangrovi (ex Huang et al. 2023) TaxID=2976432 RepID=A0ABT2I462_9SPHN|nr:HNH endonuclease [Novosphingobium mangrovi (ex Huang et al. 2023)]MCT2399433.1 HNH endonuclease [Novosphingobium mangrovi (ex Huang et al. 2023)]
MARKDDRVRAQRVQGKGRTVAGNAGTCWLCSRLLGRRIEWHHRVPKSRGGRETVPLHPICHRTIHATFTNAELARMPEGVEALLESEELRRFVRWVSGKHPDFHARTARRR